MKKIYYSKYLIILLFMCLFSKVTFANDIWEINEGIEKYQKDEISEAETFFKGYINNNPNDKDGYFWLAKIYSHQKLKNEKLSEEYYKKFYYTSIKSENIEQIAFKKIDVNKINDYFDMATMYFENGDNIQANKYADLILQLNPETANAYFIKAKVAQINKKEEEAKKYLALALTFDNRLIHTKLAKSLNMYNIPEINKETYAKIAQKNFYTGNIDKAIKNSLSYIALDKTNVNMYYLLIEAYLKNNDMKQAKNILQQANQIFENNISLLILNAKIAHIENNTKEELKYLLQAEKINPNEEKILYQLSNIYIKEKEYKKAKEVLQKLIIIDDEMYEGLYNYIISQLGTLNIREATNSIHALTQLNKNASDTNYLLALICEYQNDFKSAEEYLEQATKQNKNAYYFLELAKIQYLTGHFSQSVTNLKMVEKLTQDTQVKNEADDYLIKNYLNMKEIENAESIINTKISLDKNRFIYKYNLYVLHKLKKDNIGQKNQLAQLKRFKPNSIEDYIDLSEMNYELSGANSATKIINKALKKYPDNNELFLQKNKINFRANKVKE